MKTNITFKALQRGKVVRKTLSIEHHDYDVIPSEEFNGFELPPISIESQVIDYLDGVDKSDIMAKYDWDIILDYYPSKQKISPMRGDEVADFMKDESISLDERLVKAHRVFDSQGHSGMSASLMFSMLCKFCPNGEKLVEYLRK